MKRALLLVAVLSMLMTIALMTTGCEPTGHDRYREMTYRRSADADTLGIQDDFDASVLMTDRPTHLSSWFHN